MCAQKKSSLGRSLMIVLTVRSKFDCFFPSFWGLKSIDWQWKCSFLTIELFLYRVFSWTRSDFVIFTSVNFIGDLLLPNIEFSHQFTYFFLRLTLTLTVIFWIINKFNRCVIQIQQAEFAKYCKNFYLALFHSALIRKLGWRRMFFFVRILSVWPFFIPQGYILILSNFQMGNVQYWMTTAFRSRCRSKVLVHETSKHFFSIFKS